MKISIINPNLTTDPSILDVGITYLATYLNERTHHRASIIDFTYHKKDWQEHLEKNIQKYQPDIIGITCVSMYMGYIKDFIKEIKTKYNLPIILGGYHVTLMPEDSIQLDGVDAVCLGDGEYTVTEYLDAIENNKSFEGIAGLWAKQAGKIIKNELRELIQDIDSLPIPNYDLWEDFDKFVFYNGVIYFVGNRGCPYNCTYCSEKPMKDATRGKYLRMRDPRAYAREIKTQWEKYKDKLNIKVAHTFDAVFPFNKEWVFEFCDEYKKIGLAGKLPFSIFTRADTIDEERIKALVEIGLKIARIGIEAGNDRIRMEIYKKNITTEQYRKTIGTLHKYGVAVTGYNMLGGPDETLDTMRDTFNLVKELKVDRPIFFTYRPLPMTEGAAKVIEYGGRVDNWKKIDSLHMYSNVHTKHLTPLEIVLFRYWCLLYFTSRRSLLLIKDQGLNFFKNLIVYLFKGFKDGIGFQYIIGYFFVAGGINCVH